ncbi:GGDEF domain-containing protein [Candidatus Woesearchaeota archaeon]|nr:GGDEF domain-containing protein [Candidatus Woesearchaeota archaeon]
MVKLQDTQQELIQEERLVIQDLYIPIAVSMHKIHLPFLVVRPFNRVLRVIYANMAALEFFGYKTIESIINVPLRRIIDPTVWLNYARNVLEENDRIVKAFIRDPDTGRIIDNRSVKAYAAYTIIESIEYFSLLFIPPELGGDFDSLTKLRAIKSFYKELTGHISRLEKKRKKEDLSLLFIDIDNFKKVNDILGHREGDKLLLGVVEIIKSCLRLQDYLYRYGGDEFALILPNTGLETAIKISYRILEKFDKNRKVLPKKIRKKIGLSIGISLWKQGLKSIHMVERADLAMYAAKNNGGMRIGIYNNETGKIYVKNTPFSSTKGFLSRLFNF